MSSSLSVVGSVISRVLALALFLPLLLAGCADTASMALFYANSSALGWEGFVAGITFREQTRVEHSGRIQVRIVARAARPENNYLLTLDSTWDRKSTHITVARGANFYGVISTGGYFDFLEDMSDGKQHDFDLQKSSTNVAGTLKLKLIR